jgi:F-type H+-transporting ATPase subunit epsilon
MANEFQLEILTPDNKAFSGPVTYVKACGIEGYFGILVNHAPMLSALRIGEIEIEAEHKRKFFAVSGGFLEVLNNHVSILAETAEPATSIDVARADASKKRAEERMKSKAGGIDFERAQLALVRSLNRLKISKRV